MFICDRGNLRVQRWFQNDNQADIINDRVVMWPAGAREGPIVAGGNGQGNGTHQLQEPHAVLVDYMGTVYVADIFNSRIVRWLPNSQSGVIIIDALGANLN
ncbi:unnamed protein product, partial [Rotaria magnacalcarata]